MADSPHAGGVVYQAGPAGTDVDTPHLTSLPPGIVLDIFYATTSMTDSFILDHGLGNYYSDIRPRSTMLCAAYIVEAFETMGCSLRSANPGQRLATLRHLPKHGKFLKELQKILGPKQTDLVEVVDGYLIRTSVACPIEPASTLLEKALQAEPNHAAEFKLVTLTGCQLAEDLTGKADSLHVIFGTAEGRNIVSDVYASAPINLAWIKKAATFIQRLLHDLLADSLRIHILELGAGTCGTTATIVPILAMLGRLATYTFTDLSPSLVAAARRRLKQYPFMEFRGLNIESAPEKDLVHSHHIFLANACVHATRSLPILLRNMYKMLRSDGILLLLEKTKQLPWVEFVFGLLEGWWRTPQENSCISGKGTSCVCQQAHWC